MATALEVPVLWKETAGSCIQGTVVVATSELSVGGSDDGKVSDLIKILDHKFQASAASSHGTRVRRVDALLLYGTRLSHDRLISSVIVTLSACCPRLVATTRMSRRRVKIASIFVKPLTLKIQDRTGISTATQLLTFAGRPLRGDRTLDDYAAYSECTLHLALRLRGGFTTDASTRLFADVSNDSLLQAYPFRHAPHWRKVGEGLNLEGRCESESRAAFGQWVIQPNGFNSFNLRLDGNIRCPACASKVTPLTCWLCNCVWKYEGVRAGGTLLSSPWANAFGSRQAHHFDVDENHGIVAWESLVVSVKPREVAQAAKLGPDASGTLTTSRDEMCSVCWSPPSSMKQFKTIACGHSVHRACIKEWAKWCKRGRVLFNCPVCRKDLSAETATETPAPA